MLQYQEMKKVGEKYEKNEQAEKVEASGYLYLDIASGVIQHRMYQSATGERL